MITALIRTHPGREEVVGRAMASAEGCGVLIHHGEKTPGYEYNGYCNILKEKVSDGYFFFLDSDDFIIPGALERIKKFLKPDYANIVQMLRKGRPAPRIGTRIVRGQIGMPCLILHSKWKDIADISESNYGDYEWIKKVSERIPINFIKIPLVNAGSRSYGK